MMSVYYLLRVQLGAVSSAAESAEAAALALSEATEAVFAAAAAGTSLFFSLSRLLSRACSPPRS